MCDLMTFPDTFDEFIEKYKFVDKEQIYTNGAELIPVFRVKQWAEHIGDVKPVVRGEWVGYPECMKYPNAYADHHVVCSACEECFSVLDNDTERFNFCPHCGSDMRGEKDG